MRSFTFENHNSDHLVGGGIRRTTGGSTYTDIFSNTTTGTSGITLSTAGSTRLTVDHAGSVGIGTNSPGASAILELSSTGKGFLLPRVTTTQRDAISSPATGLQVYNTTANKPEFYDGDSWEFGRHRRGRRRDRHRRPDRRGDGLHDRLQHVHRPRRGCFHCVGRRQQPRGGPRRACRQHHRQFQHGGRHVGASIQHHRRFEHGGRPGYDGHQYRGLRKHGRGQQCARRQHDRRAQHGHRL